MKKRAISLLKLSFVFFLSACNFNNNKEEKKYKISFNFDNGAEKQIVYYKPGEKVEYPTTEKEGYTFVYWKSNTLGAGIVETMPEYDLSYTAFYRLITYNVTYVIENKPIKTETCSVEKPLEILDYSKPGYNFEGWFLDEEYNAPYTSYKNFTSSDITLYGKLIQDNRNYTLHLNGGKIATPITMTYDFCDVYGTKYQAELNYGDSIFYNPQRNGETLNGWYLDKEHTRRYEFNEEVTEGFTLYGKWNNSPSESLENKLIEYNTINKLSMDGTGTHNGETDYKYFLLQIYKTGSYNLKYGTLASNGLETTLSKNEIKFNVVNATSNFTIVSSETVGGTSYKYVTFTANEGDQIRIRMNQRVYNSQCIARVEINSENTSYLDESKVVSTSSKDVTGSYLRGYNYSFPTTLFKDNCTFNGWMLDGKIVESNGLYNFENNSHFYASWTENK